MKLRRKFSQLVRKSFQDQIASFRELRSGYEIVSQVQPWCSTDFGIRHPSHIHLEDGHITQIRVNKTRILEVRPAFQRKMFVFSAAAVDSSGSDIHLLKAVKGRQNKKLPVVAHGEAGSPKERIIFIRVPKNQWM